MHAMILELFKDKISEKSRILDVNSGCGYFTTIMAKISGNYVYGISQIP
jgi:protein-L-isoaspartate O-methyltransferase